MAESCQEKPVILTGRFYINKKKQKVILTETYLSWENENCPESSTRVPLQRILALTPCDCAPDSSLAGSKCYFCRRHIVPSDALQSRYLRPRTNLRVYFAAPRDRFRWHLQALVLRPVTDGPPALLHEWAVTLRSLLQKQKRPRRCLVFINPNSGKKRAQDIYRKVYPLFSLASIKTEEIVTQRVNHARDLLMDKDLSKYDGIVGVGGDGMFAELLNGLLARAQLDQEVNQDDPKACLAPSPLPIGIIPAGSTDAMAFSVTGVNDPISSALHIIMGHQVGIDVTSVYHQGKLLRYNSSFLGYGYFGDLMAESEKFRWMGPKRYNWAGVKTILCNRTYSGQLKILRTTPPDDKWHLDRCVANCKVCTEALFGKDAMEGSKCNLDWVTLTGRYKAVNVATLSCRCGISKEGISPSAHLGDGFADIILVKRCSRWNFIRYLTRTSLHNKSPLDLNFVELHRVKEFHFTPLSQCEEDESLWNCDGEIIRQSSIQARVHCQLVSVFGNGVAKDQGGATCCCAWLSQPKDPEP